ncbi:MAG: hypothetical protein WCA19_09115 [Candidatus Acidiferrales bacterium]
MNAEKILARLTGVRRSGAGWIARCPAHEDRSPSLSIHEGDGGRVLLYCHAQCSIQAICAAMKIKVSDLFSSESHPVQVKPQIVREAEREITGLRSRLTPRERALPITVIEIDLAALDAAIARGLALSVEQEIVQIIMVEGAA